MVGSVPGSTYSSQASVYSPSPAASADVAAYQNSGTMSQVPNYNLVSSALPQPLGSQPPQQQPPSSQQNSYSQKALL